MICYDCTVEQKYKAVDTLGNETWFWSFLKLFMRNKLRSKNKVSIRISMENTITAPLNYVDLIYKISGNNIMPRH